MYIRREIIIEMDSWDTSERKDEVPVADLVLGDKGADSGTMIR